MSAVTPRENAQLPPDLLTVQQAAARMGIAAETLYRLIRADSFEPAVKITPSTIRISVPRLEQFLHGAAS